MSATKRVTVVLSFVLSAACLLALFLLVVQLTGGVSGGADALRERLQRAAVHCYALEGAYPPDVGYLEQHYGVAIDLTRYYVRYDYAAPELQPNILVFEN